METPPRPVSAGALISWPKNASCSRIPPRASHAPLTPRRSATTCIESSLTPPLPCASILQPATPPQVVALESWTISAPICLNCFTLGDFWQILEKCKDLDLTLLHILILGAYSKFVRKNKMLALGVCFHSPALALFACLLRADHVWITADQLVRFQKKEYDEMLCKRDRLGHWESLFVWQRYPTPLYYGQTDVTGYDYKRKCPLDLGIQ